MIEGESRKEYAEPHRFDKMNDMCYVRFITTIGGIIVENSAYIQVLLFALPGIFTLLLSYDIYNRNKTSRKYLQVALLALSHSLYFFSESIRHLVPFEWSLFLFLHVSGPLAACGMGIGFHLYLYLSQMEQRFPVSAVITVSYFPFAFIIILLLTGRGDWLISGVERGPWGYLLVNGPGFPFFMIVSMLYLLLYVWLMYSAKYFSVTDKRRKQ